MELNKHLNVIVGDNECGKSTLLEAIYLALSGVLNGRPLQTELHPYLFCLETVQSYIQALIDGKKPTPPAIIIELYFSDDPSLAALKGTNNLEKDDVPGVRLSVEFNEEYSDEFASYIADPTLIRTLPIEYYSVHWRSFAGNEITARSIPIKPSFVDASTIRNNMAANRYVLDIVRDSLDSKQKVELALSYRMMKDKFLQDEKVAEINKGLAAKKGDLSDKALTISLDTSSRASWETGVMPHLDSVPMTLVGKGEQNSIKIKLAMESSANCHLFLVEEAENHLSFSNLNTLIAHISERRGDRQLLITTHSSYVMNKLGVDAVHLFVRGKSTRFSALPPDTQEYFLKLPGYDTLRLILSKEAILVEGPSDELIVQRAYQMLHGRLPVEAGVDVISVGSLAFKRFLQIAALIDAEVTVVTDNDGDVDALVAKYFDFKNCPNMFISYSEDVDARSLEDQLLKVNGRDLVNSILGTSHQSDQALLKFMKNNKTDVALRFFKTEKKWTPPSYIQDAIT